jgi:hypothetical protein
VGPASRPWNTGRSRGARASVTWDHPGAAPALSCYWRARCPSPPSAGLDVGLTPVAFLVASAGIKAGTGWDIGAIGLGVNDAGQARPDSFGGLVCSAYLSGTLRFDLAALMPGDWNHVVLLASPMVEYVCCTGAANGESWIWEADAGMNFNGWKLKLSGFLGYRMPLALDMLGVLCEAERYIGDVARISPRSSSGGWGSDAPRALLGPVIDFDLGEGASVAVLLQFKAGAKWSDATTMEEDFRSRDYESLFWCFHRVAFDFTLAF